jgi:hypothetical protein
MILLGERKQARRGRNHAEGWPGVRIDALKIHARRAEYSLTENATSPFQAEKNRKSFNAEVTEIGHRGHGEELGVLLLRRRVFPSRVKTT